MTARALRGIARCTALLLVLGGCGEPPEGETSDQVAVKTDAFTTYCSSSNLGCSVPYLAYALSPALISFGEGRFHSACVGHDHCYRHGATTYGYSKADCDHEFKDDMDAECGDWEWYDVLTFGISKVECYARATAFYEAVVAWGGSSYHHAPELGCCEYKGPATTLACGCVPSCGGRVCGSAGCVGVSCGTCPNGTFCVGYSCEPPEPSPCFEDFGAGRGYSTPDMPYCPY